jgi:hypothetical protein
MLVSSCARRVCSTDFSRNLLATVVAPAGQSRYCGTRFLFRWGLFCPRGTMHPWAAEDHPEPGTLNVQLPTVNHENGTNIERRTFKVQRSKFGVRRSRPSEP